MRRVLAVSVLVVALAGCGGGSDAEEPASTPSGGSGSSQTASSGKQLFTDKCGSCHTLEAAGTGGTFGPNLDDLKPDQERVLAKIAAGGGGMPAGLYEGEDAKTVAKFVATSAGQ